MHKTIARGAAALAVLMLAHAASAAEVDLTKRRAIEATPAEYNHVIGDMHKMFRSLSETLEALSKNDWSSVEKIAWAHRPGASMQETDPASKSFHEKLPPEWRQLGRAMHQSWLALATNAKEARDKDRAIGQLGTIGAQCASCHASFMIRLTDR